MVAGVATPQSVLGMLLAPGGQGSRLQARVMGRCMWSAIPVQAPLLFLLHALQEAAGEEGHGHEQDDGTTDDGGDDGHLEAKGLMGYHSCEGDKTSFWVWLTQASQQSPSLPSGSPVSQGRHGGAGS